MLANAIWIIICQQRLKTFSARYVLRNSYLACGWVCLFLMGCASPPPQAVSPGIVPTLAADEGLLIIDIDSDLPIERIAANGGIAAENLSKGLHTWIVRAPAGKYRWSRFDFRYQPGSPQLGWEDSGEEEFEFEVVAGKLNYPGEIIVRSYVVGRSSGLGLRVRNRNHSAMAVRALRNTHGSIVDAFPLHYSGSSGDAFLTYYSEERSAPSEIESYSPAPIEIEAPRIGMSAELLYSSDGIHWVEVSPDGQWAVAYAQTRRKHGVLIQRLGSNEVQSVIAVRDPLVSLSWIGPSTFFASFNRNGFIKSVIGRVRIENGEIKTQQVWVDAPGYLIDPLPLDRDRVIWSFDWKGYSNVNRIQVNDLVDYRAKHAGNYDPSRMGEKLASVRGRVRKWVVDRKGVPRAALRRDESGYTMLVRGAYGRIFYEAYDYEDDDEGNEIVPMSVSADGRKLIVSAYNGHDTAGLVEFDMKTHRFGKTIFRRDDVDVDGVVLDFINLELVAAVYHDAGERRFHYFETATKKQMRNVDRSHDGDQVYVVSGSADRKSLVLFVAGATNPGHFLFYDGRTGRSVEIGKRVSKVDRDRLVKSEAIIAESSDGTSIEAYLTVPDSSVRSTGVGAPLVVLPHGGPIGVRDTSRFDPMVQYLASWGFAVLKVNYRGSSGFGLEFEEAGKQQWAQAIEDDIDAAVEIAMVRADIDGTRLCIMGGSYGGFSALASLVRHDERYRCGATINGVTDIPLMFDSSDFADYDDVLESFAEVAGDIEEDRDKLLDLSPAYAVAKMRVPVFVVYGTEDRRVDADHAHRLLLMLETYGKSRGVLEIRDGAHSPTAREWVILTRTLRRFLTAHLFAPGEFTPDPQVTTSTFDILLDIDH